MNTLSDRILTSLPMKISFLVGKIALFPFYLVYRLLKDVWEDVRDLGGGLWDDWYRG